MIQRIKMPAAGQTTDEARITSIKVKTGDSVKRGDVLIEAETDKAILPVESYAAGVILDVLVEEGDDVRSGDVLVVVGSEADRGAYVRDSGPAVKKDAAAADPVAKTEGAQCSSQAEQTARAIKMPAAGQTTDAARVTDVRVKVGDRIKRGDLLLEVETDKAVLPVESYLAGVVQEIKVKAGDDVRSGDVLVLVDTGESRAAAGPAPMERAAAAETAAAAGQEPDEEEYVPILRNGTAPCETRRKWPAMPNAKMLARELGVNLAEITPANGKIITRRDVRAAEAKGAVPASAPETVRQDRIPEAEYEVLDMTKVREVIGRRMLESTQNIPAWQCTVEINMEACMALKKDYQEKRGIKVSYNDIMAKAIAAAAQKFRLVRARYEQGEIRIYRHTNIGLAVGLEDALLVPVVKEIDTMGLEQIAQQYHQMVEKARGGRLAPGDMGCGSVTISNLGMFDVERFTAIVNPPESCILAVGSILVRPVWDGEKFVPVHTMIVTGSFDHRMIDGAYGAKFLRELKLLMENPVLMLG